MLQEKAKMLLALAIISLAALPNITCPTASISTSTDTDIVKEQEASRQCLLQTPQTFQVDMAILETQEFVGMVCHKNRTRKIEFDIRKLMKPGEEAADFIKQCLQPLEPSAFKNLYDLGKKFKKAKEFMKKNSLVQTRFPLFDDEYFEKLLADREKKKAEENPQAPGKNSHHETIQTKVNTEQGNIQLDTSEKSQKGIDTKNLHPETIQSENTNAQQGKPDRQPDASKNSHGEFDTKNLHPATIQTEDNNTKKVNFQPDSYEVSKEKFDIGNDVPEETDYSIFADGLCYSWLLTNPVIVPNTVTCVIPCAEELFSKIEEILRKGIPKNITIRDAEKSPADIFSMVAVLTGAQTTENLTELGEKWFETYRKSYKKIVLKFYKDEPKDRIDALDSKLKVVMNSYERCCQGGCPRNKTGAVTEPAEMSNEPFFKWMKSEALKKNLDHDLLRILLDNDPHDVQMDQTSIDKFTIGNRIRNTDTQGSDAQNPEAVKKIV